MLINSNFCIKEKNKLKTLDSFSIPSTMKKMTDIHFSEIVFVDVCSDEQTIFTLPICKNGAIFLAWDMHRSIARVDIDAV